MLAAFALAKATALPEDDEAADDEEAEDDPDSDEDRAFDRALHVEVEATSTLFGSKPLFLFLFLGTTSHARRVARST